jgi:hypothetical protein
VQPKLVEHCVRVGQEAWTRLTNNQTFTDWLLVGEALLVGRAESMRTAHTNKPEGRAYNAEFSDWLKKNKFDGINKSTRSRLFECLAHRAEIEAWIVTLATSERLKKLNHPAVVLRNWQKTRVKKADEVKPQSAIAKLRATIIELEEQNHRLQRDSKDRAPFTPQDRPKDIAGFVWRTIQRTPKLARSIARDLIELAKEAGKIDTTEAGDLVWEDKGNACLDPDAEYHMFEARAAKGYYSLSPASDAFNRCRFCGYTVKHYGRTKKPRIISDGIKSADEAKAIAQADHDRGGD